MLCGSGIPFLDIHPIEMHISGVPFMAQQLTNPTRIHEDVGSIPDLTQWVRIWCFHELWCRPAAVAPIRPLARELPHATNTALKTKKFKKLKNLCKNIEFPMWQWVKDLALLQLWHRLQLWPRFDPWPRNFHMTQVQLQKEKRKMFTAVLLLMA